MKTRSDFVTNSSSSSFVIKKNGLSPEQLRVLADPGARIMDYKDKFIAYTIDEYKKYVDDQFPKREDGRIVIPGYYDSVEDYLDMAGDWQVVNENEDEIRMWTPIDNFNLRDLLNVINIPKENIEFGGYDY